MKLHEIFIICSLFCYGMYTCRNMCKSFDFGEEILIIKGFTKMGFKVILVVQTFGLL